MAKSSKTSGKNSAANKSSGKAPLPAKNGKPAAASKPAASKPAASKPAASKPAASKPAGGLSERNPFGVAKTDGGHFICAALAQLSGKALAPVAVVDVYTTALKLAPAGHRLREPNGILNALRVSGFAVRAGRGLYALTADGWARWSSGKAPTMTILQFCAAARAAGAE